MRRRLESREAVDRLQRAAACAGRDLSFMEVCGTHTVNAFRSGLHSLLPSNIKLLSGPGCPVCVTSQGDIDQMIELSRDGRVTICTYGDMLRVVGRSGSLQEARAEGADVRVIYSALDAVELAKQLPARQVVLAAIGFETTAPATAVAIKQAFDAGLENFSALISHKCILPAMRALLDGTEVGVNGFILPGHVSVITGSEIFREIVQRYRMPCVVTGFEGTQIAAALARLIEMCVEGEPRLENLYPQAVTPEGNLAAQQIIDEIFEPSTVAWRGLGELPDSGLALRAPYAQFDAHRRFSLAIPDNTEPPGCRCGEVITGKATPRDCPLFAKVCTPVNAIGPCMVSSEGTCQAWFKYHRRSVPSAVGAAS
jgi:hydrogenase expression/formation protein HypD